MDRMAKINEVAAKRISEICDRYADKKRRS